MKDLSVNKTYGTFTSEAEVRFQRLLPGPIETVWEYLTDSEKRGTWLAKGTMELKVGGKVELNFLHSSLSDEKRIRIDSSRWKTGSVEWKRSLQLTLLVF